MSVNEESTRGPMLWKSYESEQETRLRKHKDMSDRAELQKRLKGRQRPKDIIEPWAPHLREEQ